MKKTTIFTVLAMSFLLYPQLSSAQGVAADLHGFQGTLSHLYDQMMPLCKGIINVARGIGGFATLFYIGGRVWKHLASAEPIDFYPLMRPFAIGFCILNFPLVLNVMNGFLQPTVTATNALANNSNEAVMRLLDPALQNNKPNGATANTAPADPDKYYQYTHPDNSANNGSSGNPIADAFSGWSIKNMVRKWIAELLNVLFEAAALCLDTIRTFKLIVLSIMGPIVFGFSIFEDFRHTLKQWIARYVNVFMWLPVANIFGAIIAKIQENLVQLAQTGDASGAGHFSETTGYLIFLVIGITGYFAVPGIANYIVNVGGHALLNRTSALASMATSYVSGAMVSNIFSGSKNNSQTTNNSNSSPGKTDVGALKGKLGNS